MLSRRPIVLAAVTDNQDLPELNDVSKADDHQWPLQRALRNGAIALAVIGVASLSLWGALRDLPGIYGALIGIAIGGGFMLATVLSVLFTARTSPAMTMGVVLGSWLVKAAVLLLLMVWLKGQDFYDATALGVTVLLTLIAVLTTETIAVTRAQRLFVGS